MLEYYWLKFQVKIADWCYVTKSEPHEGLRAKRTFEKILNKWARSVRAGSGSYFFS
jgi:hypothetical protein